MSFFPQSHRYGRLAGFLFLALLATVSAHSQERADCRAFHSAILHSSVRYCVYLPASYSSADAKTRKYPVLYLLHGLGGNEQSMALDGEWTTLQDLRRDHQVGEFLLVALIHRGIEVGARWTTLEVRASNTVAQSLYRKYTFKEMGVRRRYYSDNGEDALVMWTDALDSDSFLSAMEHHERKLAERLGSAEVRLGDRVWSLSDG